MRNCAVKALRRKKELELLENHIKASNFFFIHLKNLSLLKIEFSIGVEMCGGIQVHKTQNNLNKATTTEKRSKENVKEIRVRDKLFINDSSSNFDCMFFSYWVEVKKNEFAHSTLSVVFMSMQMLGEWNGVGEWAKVNDKGNV